MKEAPTLQPGLPELVHFQLTEAAFTDSSWKSALRAAMRVLEEPRYLKAERLAAVRRGIEETVEKFGDQHPTSKGQDDRLGQVANTVDRRFCRRIETGGTLGGND